MKKKLKSYLQNQFSFTSNETEQILYSIQGIVAELSKFFILFFISLPLGYADKVLIATIVLLSIRCNCGGLHFSHYISCFIFTTLFYYFAILLSTCPLPDSFLAFGLLVCSGLFTFIGPITSPMRPRLQPSEVQKYSHRVSLLLFMYSSALILLKTLPYRNLIYWVIVLQIFQLLCAKIARKGELYEKIYHTKDL